MPHDYSSFFRTALRTEGNPFGYQTRLAKQDWPDLIEIPTGLGKTAAIIVAWLYKRLGHESGTPRRLVYCLPMRTLVEQTVDNAKTWIDNLTEAGIYAKSNAPKVATLMGGVCDKDWDIDPVNDSLIVGTQDQLISRALNRGYGISRFRWPIDFGLLNNDCLWIMDEVQLMGAGLSTTAQLEAFRRSMGTVLPCRSIWMSATIQANWLNTVDFKAYLPHLTKVSLSDEECQEDAVRQRIKAEKVLYKAKCDLAKPVSVAKFVLEKHQPHSLTLVVLNRVKQAQAIFEQLVENTSKDKTRPEIILIHSRFRLKDRIRLMQRLLEKPNETGTICVSTQVVEAGVDVSAKTLITELAPWSSMIQRFGRGNRYGIEKECRVYWIDVQLGNKSQSVPYDAEDLAYARQLLESLENQSIASADLPGVEETKESRHVLRKKDVLDLFDTTPDLAGLDIDVSRFIRDENELDAQVFWRNISHDQTPQPSQPEATRAELCKVAISSIKESERDCWIWDHIDEKWNKPKNISPGMTLMLRSCDGGYSEYLGWTGRKTDIPEVLPINNGHSPEGIAEDPMAYSRLRETLVEHTDKVVERLKDITNRLAIDMHISNELISAGRWHDAGKSHAICQEALNGSQTAASSEVIWAKSNQPNIRYRRKGFRHELASGLAMLQSGCSDLSMYLVMSHHGKVRCSIRSLAKESKPPDPSARSARGIWEGDLLPKTELGDGIIMPETILSLASMEIGRGSYVSNVLTLCGTQGPFRLSFLESLLRCADWQASGQAEGVE